MIASAASAPLRFESRRGRGVPITRHVERRPAATGFLDIPMNDGCGTAPYGGRIAA